MTKRMTEWTIDAREGLGLAIGLMITIILVNAGLVWLAVDRARFFGAVGLGTFAIGLAVLISLWLLAGLGYRSYGLAHAHYLFDRNALIIHWGATRHVVPLGDVERVLTGEEVEGRILFRGSRWPGHCVGHGRLPGGEPTLFYSTVPPTQQIYLVTPGVSYGISPANRQEFLDALKQRWEMGPTQTIEHSSSRPALFDWAVWRDQWGLALLAVGLVAVLALVGLLCYRFPTLPSQVPLHFDAAGDPDRLVPRGQSFTIPLIGLLILLFNGGLGILAYARERMISYLLWGGTILIQALTWTAAIGVLTGL